jgi:hypothetical protein
MESSVYNFSMVLEEPPAPAARVELGFATCEVLVARRLRRKHIKDHGSNR